MDRQPTAGRYLYRHYLIVAVGGSKYRVWQKLTHDLLHETLALGGCNYSLLSFQLSRAAGSTAIMSSSKAIRIGSLLFCPACGTLLDLPGDSDEIVCDGCARREPASCKSISLFFRKGRSETYFLPLSLREPEYKDVLAPSGLPILAAAETCACAVERRGWIKRKGQGSDRTFASL